MALVPNGLLIVYCLVTDMPWINNFFTLTAPVSKAYEVGK
jgi:hypothetical protein